MSRGYSKVYNRKLNAVSQTSIQFDKLFQENSNRPSAAKSAGTVGKWGVISCTSLRSTNFNGRRDEIFGNKKPKLDYSNRSSQNATSKDPFSFEADTADKVVSAPKPKKFFKSRNIDMVSSEEIRLNASVYVGSNRSTESTYGSHGGKKYGKGSYSSRTQQCSAIKNSGTVSSGDSMEEQVEAMNLSSHTKITAPLREENKPPIVLRIFKGTSHLVNEIKEPSSVQQPPKSMTTHESNKEKSYASITSPKKSNKTNKEAVRNNNTSELMTGEKKKTVESQNLTNNEHVHVEKQTICDKRIEEINEQEQNIPNVYEGIQTIHDEKENIISEGIISEVDMSSIQYPTLQKTKSATPVPEIPTSLPEELESLAVAPVATDLTNSGDLDKEDQEKLLKAEELLSSTYVDFSTATEKLLMSGPKETSKTIVDQDWFSDSEDSNSIADQINTIASSQGEYDTQGLVETTKKGSIFKSRSLLSDASKKRLALYKHKWADDKDGTGGGSQTETAASSASKHSSQPSGGASTYSDLEEDFEPAKLTRVVTWPPANTDVDDDAEAITSIKCNRKVKAFFTVVRNVKKAHQIQESGEFQEFNDDVEFFLDALQDNNPIGTRCLSAITLASKCMAPAFRMHVRAHGTVTKFFRALHDATKDQSLGLCTATVMFVLSQDRLNMDLDRHSLELMLNLLESDASHRNALDDCGMSSIQLHKNKQKVRELCAEIQSQGHAKHLNLDNITVGQLAMETLLSLTSRRAGEWFKEELRELGGLEHIVKTICDCCRQVDDYIVEWTDPLLDKLRKIDRCLRVLENVNYIETCSRIILHLIDCYQKLQDLGYILLLFFYRTSITYGSTVVGTKPGIIDASLHLLLQVPNYVPEEKKFDLLVLALILLINLVEHSKPNRRILFEARAPADPESIFVQDEKSAVEALILLFYQHEELARVEEVKTDAILDGKKDSAEVQETEAAPPKSYEEFIEETVANLLQKAGRNMEHTLIGAYVGLLLGYLIMDNMEFELYVRQCLPEKNFKLMVMVLQKVYNFMNLTASAVGSSRGIAQTERVINYLEQSDMRAEVAVAAAVTAAAAAVNTTNITTEEMNTSENIDILVLFFRYKKKQVKDHYV
ncbi:hypothetical protein L9F63_022498, partial [Diploptera punctata]